MEAREQSADSEGMGLLVVQTDIRDTNRQLLAGWETACFFSSSKAVVLEDYLEDYLDKSADEAEVAVMEKAELLAELGEVLAVEHCKLGSNIHP